MVDIDGWYWWFPKQMVGIDGFHGFPSTPGPFIVSVVTALLSEIPLTQDKLLLRMEELCTVVRTPKKGNTVPCFFL